jgi:hypothetical protein
MYHYLGAIIFLEMGNVEDTDNKFESGRLILKTDQFDYVTGEQCTGNVHIDLLLHLEKKFFKIFKAEYLNGAF